MVIDGISTAGALPDVLEFDNERIRAFVVKIVRKYPNGVTEKKVEMELIRSGLIAGLNPNTSPRQAVKDWLNEIGWRTVHKHGNRWFETTALFTTTETTTQWVV